MNKNDSEDISMNYFKGKQFQKDVMNDNDIKRNIIVSVVGLVSILSLLLFEISLVGSDINFYLLLIMER